MSAREKTLLAMRTVVARVLNESLSEANPDPAERMFAVSTDTFCPDCRDLKCPAIKSERRNATPQPCLQSSHQAPRSHKANTRLSAFSFLRNSTLTRLARPCVRLHENGSASTPRHFDARNSASFPITSRNSLRFFGLILENAGGRIVSSPPAPLSSSYSPAKKSISVISRASQII